MADESGANAQVAAPAREVPAAAETSVLAPGDSKKPAVFAPDAPAPAAAHTEKPAAEEQDQAAQPPQSASAKGSEAADAGMKNEPTTADAPQAAESTSLPAGEAAATAAADAAAEAPTTPSTDKLKGRRKSMGLSESKGKKLNKKGSKARILHLDAKPGDHFFVKLKGYPQWPVVVCDDDMLPQTLLATRPVSAKRGDGTYRQDFADGGKRAPDRTFPVMYLHTNEFGWVPNSDLHDLDPTTVLGLVNDKMRKDLQKAHQLAAEAKPLSHYKAILREFQDNLERQQREMDLAKKSKKAKPASAAGDDEDVEMADTGEEAAVSSETKSKKRKAEDEAHPPQRTDSVKKPKFKVISNSTPKAAANGTPTPKSTKSSESKPSKPKSKKESKSEDKKAEKEAQLPKEPELSPEEKHARKEKEVLFLRHKLQKGLLTRDQEPKAEEMKLMSDYITKLEGFPDLEVSIIRSTKINKVLKAILKLESIPKEDDFHFKTRSQALLDKWNKLLAVDVAPQPASTTAAPAADAPATAGSSNGVNGQPAAKAVAKGEGAKVKLAEATNGVKESGEAKGTKGPVEPAAAKEAQSSTDKTPADAEAVESTT